MMDAPNGFMQLCVELSSQEKLAFAVPHASKYTFQVMPFSPVNGTVIFIIFMHDTAGTWKKNSAEVNNVPVKEHNNL